MSERRLPIFLLVDCSESMAGEAIENVRKGIDSLIAQLRSDPHALETVHLSTILFSRDATVDAPLTELLTFQPPRLAVRPGTALGGALRLLRDRLESDVVRSSAERRGDYKPLVFLLTDGEPTDDWMEAARVLRSLRGTRYAELYAVGCGPDVNPETLFAVSDSVYLLEDLGSVAMAKLFVWLTSSVRSASRSVRAGDQRTTDLPPAPEGIHRLESPPPAAGPRPSTQLFLHALCSRDRKPYLMRYRRGESYDGYEAVAAHPLEKVGDGGGAAAPPVALSRLYGAPSCPYCENPTWAFCGGCGTFYCVVADAIDGTCVKCNAYSKFVPGADLTAATSQG